MQRVYIPNNSGHDFSGAEEYGELVFVTEGLLSKFQVNQMYRKVADKMQDSNPEDYILATGLTQINIICATAFAYLHGRINLLIYDVKENEYVSRTVILGNLLNKEGEKDEHNIDT